MLYGVDVHDGYQAGLSFSLLRSQGYSFAAVKLTQGTTYERDLGDDWVVAARAAGLIPGGYHWLVRGNGAAQARWFHHKVIEAGGPDGMLIQLDCEADAALADIQAWMAEWARLTSGHPVLLYTGAWWWGAAGRRWNGSAVTPYLWHSRYLEADADTAPDDPAAFAARIPGSWWTPGYGSWPAATILQFTSKGDAGALANNVDLNVTRLTREQLLALTHAGTAQPTEDEMALPDNFGTHFLQLAGRVGALFGDHDTVEWGGAPVPTERNVLKLRLDGIEAKLDAALTAIGAIGSNSPEVATILSKLDETRAALEAEIEAAKADARDAVADLAEGGAAQVRADAP